MSKNLVATERFGFTTRIMGDTDLSQNPITADDDELNKAMYHIERNANPKLLFTDLSFTINKLLKS